MGPILPAGISPSHVYAGAARINGSTPTFQPEAPASGISTAPTMAPNDPFPVSEVYGAVTRLLSGLGGGLENDKILQMLIALLILLALMQQSQEAGPRDNLLAPGNRASGPGSLLVMTASSTTISIEQTSVYIARPSSAEALGALEPAPVPGGQVDVIA